MGTGRPQPDRRAEQPTSRSVAGSGRRLVERAAHRLGHLVAPHSHDPSSSVDSALEANRRGVRAVWVSLAVLGVTAAAQGVVVAATGSVALLGDTLHNLVDALTAVPLGVAFLLARRRPTRRFTHGYGRAEDVAGMLIVLVIAASAVLAGYASVTRLLDPVQVEHLWAVATAGVLGFVGNELVARYRVRVGRRIGSAALVADGLHARTDGMASLAVVLGAAGVALGVPLADPLVGLLITAVIVAVLTGAGRVLHRLMDAVDPALVDEVEQVLHRTPGVLGTGDVRVRWIGHRLRAECEVVVSAHLTVVEGHAIAEDARHRLLHEVPRLAEALVHADPQPDGHITHHEATAHHENPGRRR